MVQQSAAIYRHEAMPQWGAGIVLEETAKDWTIFFQHAGRKRFIKEKTKGLVVAELPDDEAAALRAKATGRQQGATAKTGRKRAAAAPRARFSSFEEQLESFERMFTGGFAGEKFVDEERGREGVTGKAGYKTAAIAAAQAELSPARFETASPDELFDAARRLLSMTNIVFPIEGPIPFGQIQDRPAAISALRDLLHGEDSYDARVGRFADSLKLADRNGKAKKVTWPMATVFGALYFPGEQTCVKPTSFAEEAATLGLQVSKSQPVSAMGYRQFLEVALQVRERLRAAGHEPRDMVDVYSFIWRTHAEKPG
jgi:hypothetical protein